MQPASAKARTALRLDLDGAVQALKKGNILVYPTETLYALGCDAANARAALRVAALKARPRSKPFPLVLGSVAQLAALCPDLPAEMRIDLERLAAGFWPGPLSVLLPTRPDLPPLARDEAGFSSVRVSPHPTVQALCAALEGPLVATSANVSGRPATADPAGLDPEILRGADGLLLGHPLPGGGKPSTLLRLLGRGKVQILRPGAVAADALTSLFELA